MPIDIQFVELLSPPNYDGAMIIKDSDGDVLTLSKQQHLTNGAFWGGMYLHGVYTNGKFTKDRPLKLIEVFLCLVDLAKVDEQTENFLPSLSLPAPGRDTFTINWTSKTGESLDEKLEQLYARFRKMTGLAP